MRPEQHPTGVGDTAKSERLMVRLRPAEYEQVRRAAQRYGMTVSDLMRDLLVAGEVIGGDDDRPA